LCSYKIVVIKNALFYSENQHRQFVKLKTAENAN